MFKLSKFMADGASKGLAEALNKGQQKKQTHEDIYV